MSGRAVGPAVVAQVIDNGFQRPVKDQTIIQQDNVAFCQGLGQILAVVFRRFRATTIDEDVLAVALMNAASLQRERWSSRSSSAQEPTRRRSA